MTYTSNLKAGLGMLEETEQFLDLLAEGDTPEAIEQRARDTGTFGSCSARRIHDLIFLVFGPRYLVEDNQPALRLKALKDHLPQRDFGQLLFLHTARVHSILVGFVNEVYWPSYAAGAGHLRREQVAEFISDSIERGLTTNRWNDTISKRMASSIVGTLADFQFLANSRGDTFEITAPHIADSTALYLAHERHFAGLADTAVLRAEEWALFGLETHDVYEVLKRLSRRGHFIVQYAGDLLRVSWKYTNMDEMINNGLIA